MGQEQLRAEDPGLTSPPCKGRLSGPGAGPSMVTSCPILKPKGSSGLKLEAKIWPQPQGDPLKTQLPKLLILFKVFQKLLEVSKLVFAHQHKHREPLYAS